MCNVGVNIYTLRAGISDDVYNAGMFLQPTQVFYKDK